jgi:hypothetical protein
MAISKTLRMLLMGCGCGALAPAFSLAGSSVAWAGGGNLVAAKMDEAAPAPAPALEVTTASATVADVDKKHRRVTLQSPSGEKTTVLVSQDVQEFDQLKNGDKIEVDYYRSLAMAPLPPGTKLDTREREVKKVSVAGTETRVLTSEVQVVSVNLNDNTIGFKGANGQVETVSVQGSDIQKNLRSLRVGDAVKLTYSEGVAVAIRPQRK